MLTVLQKTGRTNYRCCAECRSVLVEPLINHASVGRQLVEFDSDGGNNKVAVVACLSSGALAFATTPFILGVCELAGIAQSTLAFILPIIADLNLCLRRRASSPLSIPR